MNRLNYENTEKIPWNLNRMVITAPRYGRIFNNHRDPNVPIVKDDILGS